jgi:hypothetical protein
MPRISAGLLMYSIQEGKLQVLLAHPGGPLFKNKDEGVWTIPKGEIESELEYDRLKPHEKSNSQFFWRKDRFCSGQNRSIAKRIMLRGMIPTSVDLCFFQTAVRLDCL